MGFEALSAKSDDLLKALQEKAYTRLTIMRVRQMLKCIIKGAEGKGWKSYQDVLRYYEGSRLAERTITNKRYFIRLIASLDCWTGLGGILPIRHKPRKSNRHEARSFFESESYRGMPNEFKEFIEFIREIDSHRGLSQGTLKTRLGTAFSFFRVMQQRNCLGFDDIQEKDVLSFFLSDEGKLIRGFGARNALVTVFKEGTSWNKEACDRLFAFLPSLRRNRKTIQYLTEDEVSRIRNALRDKDNMLSLLSRAIGILLLNTGLRRSDISELRLDSIDWEHDSLRIIQKKTKAPLELPLTPSVGNAIYEYLTLERPESDDPHVFLSTVFPYDPISAQDVGTAIVNRIFKAAGVRQKPGDRKGTHIFRHRLASRMLANGIPLPVISQTLGHTSPGSVDSYLSADFQHLKECALSVEQFPIPEEVLPL